MKKLFLVLAILAIVASGAFATAQAEVKPTTLTVLWFNDANESDVFSATIADYLAANPNVKVDLQVVAFADYEQKLKMMISGGEAPDVARVTTNMMASLVDTFEPIDSYVADINAVKAQFMPAMLAYTLDREGHMLAYPTESTANGMLINKTAFDNAGIDVAAVSQNWTWSQWAEIMKTVIAANPTMKYGLAVDFTPHRFSTIMYQFGGHFLNADQTAMDFNNEGTINAIKFFKEMHDQNLIPKSVWLGSENPAELFQAGIVACHIGGSWNINTYNKNVKDFEWTVVRCPVGTQRSSVPGGKFVASFKASPNKVEAMKLMAAFSDKAHNEAYCLGTFNLPSRLDAQIQYPTNTEQFSVFAKDLADTPAYTASEWKSPSLAKVTTTIKEQIVQVLLGNITAEQAVKNVDEFGAQFF
jgi:alpha-1,4-digalacturonate transport system substrate-binding protein